MHDLDDAFVHVFSTLKPHVTVDAVLDAVDREVNVRNRLVLLCRAVTHRQGVFELLAIEFAFEEVPVDDFVVVLWHQI